MYTEQPENRTTNCLDASGMTKTYFGVLILLDIVFWNKTVENINDSAFDVSVHSGFSTTSDAEKSIRAQAVDGRGQEVSLHVFRLAGQSGIATLL